MQNVPVRELLGRPVFTRAGVRLGHLKDVIFDVETGRWQKLVVGRQMWGGADLLVGAEAVVEVLAEAIIVKDLWVENAAPATVA